MARAKKKESLIDAERVRRALMTAEVPIRGLTAERLARALEDFRRGHLRDAALLWQEIRERDDTTLSVSEKRDLDAALLDWEVLPLDESPEAAAHKAALEAGYNGLVATDALDQNKRGGVSGLVRAMMHCVGHKWAVFEVIWDPTGPDLTAEFRFVPLQFFENTVGRLRFLATEGAYAGEELEEGGWMVVCGPGLMKATSIAYWIKRSPLQAWSILCDKFAVPYLHGETPAAPGSKEWDDFRDALAAFVSDGAVVTSPGAKITPIQITGAEAPAATLVDRADRGISRIWRGADLGTMSKAGGAIGSNPQESETDILSAADALMVTETLNHYFDTPLIQARFGVKPRAYFKLKPRTKLNQALQLQIDEALIKWGVPRGKKDLMESYGRAEPDKGDELAEKPSASMPVPGAGFGGPPPASPLANEAAAQGRATVFQASAVNRLAPEIKAALDPILGRLAEIDAIADAAVQRAALADFRAALPELYRQAVARVPAIAAVLEQVIGTAFASGAAEHARQAKPRAT
ncbi:MAG: DUF935 family protein [Opitutaceae bacterium]|nr:DUF935 family protein [Opitutaceae bacterium]